MRLYVGFAGISAVLRKFTADLRKFTADLRKVTADLRKFTADLRKITADLPGFTADLPEFTADLPKFTADLLEFTAGLCWFVPYLFAFGIQTQIARKQRHTKKRLKKAAGLVCRPPLPRAAFSLCATCAVITAWLAACSVACLFFVVVEKEGAVGVSHKGGTSAHGRSRHPAIARRNSAACRFRPPLCHLRRAPSPLGHSFIIGCVFGFASFGGSACISSAKGGANKRPRAI